jgi:5-methyltetrahydrofolate--homocysteine methyltransferase
MPASDKEEQLMADLNTITQALIAGDKDQVTGLVQKAVDENVAANKILNEGLIKGMDIVGDRMQEGDMFIPEVLMSARAMSAAVAILKPLLGEDESAVTGKVVIGTAKGDMHDIGKNLVSMMLESAGFEIIDLGVDVAPEQFVQAVKDHQAHILGLSALLTTTMPMMQTTIDALKQSGVREQVKVLIGGAPVNQEFADKIGADGYAPDAGSASKLAKQIMG